LKTTTLALDASPAAASSVESAGIETSRDLRYRGNIPGLDELRGLAILMVLVCHATPAYADYHGLWRAVFYIASFGCTGVHLFYVLSGFLISGILIESRHKLSYFRHFYIRRALRILPAYLLILAVLAGAGIVSLRFTLACLLYVANMAGIVGARTSEFGVFWSLAVEEQFYLLWPVVIRRMRLASIARLAVAVCMATPLLRYFAAAHSLDAYYKLWDNADYLAYGGLIAAFVRMSVLHRDNVGTVCRRLLLIGSAAAALLGKIHSSEFGSSPGDAIWSAIGRLPFIALFLGLLLRALARNRRGEVRVFRPLSFLGWISYGLYLVHQLVFLVFDRVARGRVSMDAQASPVYLVLRCVVVLAASVAIAYLSRRYFEEPFLRRKDALCSRAA
jgi:peptidoglycan/LPS O-acetylase OafA/YrhL